MAVGQLTNPAGFVAILASYEIGGSIVSATTSALLIMGELGAAVGLIATGRRRRHAAASLALAVTLAWSALGAQAFARSLDLDNCGCFGVHLGQPLRWWVLIEDVELVALAWWIRTRSAITTTPPRAASILIRTGQR